MPERLEIKMKNDKIYYSVGALMYCPANNDKIASKLIKGVFANKFSLAFCLEDAIGDNHVEEAEQILKSTLANLYCYAMHIRYDFPKIFIRVRRPEQIMKLVKEYGDSMKLVSGFCVPKFDRSNAQDYVQAIREANAYIKGNTVYMMPILESHEMIDLRTRYDFLYEMKEVIDSIEPYVLNIRVGGNDLCNAFGVRRHGYETIYGVQPVASILTDILTVFSQDYVVSGPVWEYYSGSNCDVGLYNEVLADLLAGFVGKTVIHPNQIGVFNRACAVPKADYDDAAAVLGWDQNASSMVAGSAKGERMNEAKVHRNWAEKIGYMAEYYGVI